MSERAVATFDVDPFDQQPLDDGEARAWPRHEDFPRGHRGPRRVEMLTAVGAVEGSAGYVAIERITAGVKGRTRSFVLQHSAQNVRRGHTALRSTTN